MGDDRHSAPARAEPRAIDATLLGQVLAGEPTAIERWYRAEHPRVWRRCLGLVASRADADDLAQDAMLKLLDRLASRDPALPYAAWSARVVLNLCRDRHRRVEARRRAEDGARGERLERPLPDPADVASQAELRGLVAEVLSRLPEREREAFVLRELENLSTAEVALAMEIEESTVRSLTTLARRRLRELLEPRLTGTAGEREVRDV